jgi:hypothetical protein
MKRSSLLVGLIVLLLLSVDVLAASTVRGRLFREANGRTYPAQGVNVRLRDANGSIRSASSSSDGFFYFYNVASGSYSLEVLGAGTRSFSIRVEERDYTDIAPIRVP